jgi:hypothetical protein
LSVDFEFAAAGRLSAEEFAEEQADVAAGAAENDQGFQDRSSQKYIPGTCQEVDLRLKWINLQKFIVLDTWREGRLKVKHRSHVDLIVASIFEPQRASWSGGLFLFSARRFDHSTECERFAKWFFIEFPYLRHAAEWAHVRAVFDLHGGIGL